MKPPRFAYHDPRTLPEALDLVSTLENAKVLAGGQSLMPLLNFRLAAPDHLIDLNPVTELAYIREADEALTVGAMTRQRDVEFSTVVRDTCPLLHEAIRHVGHTSTRNRGTIGGSLAHLDPAAELPAVAAVLDAVLYAQHARGRRAIRMADFAVGPMTTCLRPDELLTAVSFPICPKDTSHAFCEFSRRHGDFAIVGVAVLLTLTSDGTIRKAAMAFSGIGALPMRARATENALAGQPANSDTFRSAATAVARELEPDSDIHASREYRLRLATVLTARALTMASERARRREVHH